MQALGEHHAQGVLPFGGGVDVLPKLWGFAERRPVDELVLDHVFQGWSGSALVEWPEAGQALEITADELYRHLVVYTPPGQPFFCVEPWMGFPNAMNTLLGARLLAPGAEDKGKLRVWTT